jgi:hypothetical protein
MGGFVGILRPGPRDHERVPVSQTDIFKVKSFIALKPGPYYTVYVHRGSYLGQILSVLQATVPIYSILDSLKT